MAVIKRCLLSRERLTFKRLPTFIELLFSAWAKLKSVFEYIWIHIIQKVSLPLHYDIKGVHDFEERLLSRLYGIFVIYSENCPDLYKL